MAARAARSSTPRWTICSRAAEARGSSPFWCCATASRTRTIWGHRALGHLCGARRGHPQARGVGMGRSWKASAGAAAHLPIARVSNLAQAIRTIKEHNIFRLLRGTWRCPRWQKSTWSGPVALVLGEGGGPGALNPQLWWSAANPLEMAPARLPALTATTSALRRASCAYDVMRRRLAKK